ncbi:MAG: hypothetical protein JXD22_03245, partial [Sedimentisphaerales bacterium]|nr:hypothetical protein [Sedimentisphaerales bacterium]
FLWLFFFSHPKSNIQNSKSLPSSDTLPPVPPRRGEALWRSRAVAIFILILQASSFRLSSPRLGVKYLN